MLRIENTRSVCRASGFVQTRQSLVVPLDEKVDGESSRLGDFWTARA
jgi:hypothetical protein